jgi:hexosaminidase
MMFSSALRRNGICLVFAGILAAVPMLAQTQAELNVMPLPAKAQLGSGALPVDRGFTIGFTGFHDERLDRAGKRFLVQLHRETGIVFVSAGSQAGVLAPRDAARATLVISTGRDSKLVQELGEDESYTLEVIPSGAKLNAPTALGTLRGLQTFLELVSITPNGFSVPAVFIQDQPRFPWRGLMIDSARHFMPVAVIKRNLDGMEAVKMNVFHWHLSDNQGFRVESHRFPKLTSEGSDGLFYTQEEVRDVITHARDRGIRVVPEFDMPGHSTAWFAGYPELASGPGPYQIERRWGIFDPAMDPTNEKTYKFLNDLIAEMARLFPDQYFHIGGDEVNGKEWSANPKIQDFMKAHNLKNNVELQAYFSQRVQEIVVKHGKTTIGWDEVLIPGVPRTVVIQSWRGAESLSSAAKQGYSGILSNGYYIDLGWSAARHYTVDPMGGAAANLSDDEKKRILGGESTMWSEFVNEENVDSRIWPRNAAIAERFWSPQSTSDLDSMYRRMDAESVRLEWLGLTHRTYQRQMVERMTGPASVEESAALMTLVEALEPVKDYTREALATEEPTSQMPLVRVVDAVNPESSTSRRFSANVDQFIVGSCKDAVLTASLRAQLTQWAKNDGAVEAAGQRSSIVKESTPASAALSQSAELSLSALDRIGQGLPVPDDLKKQQIDALNAFENQAHRSQLTVPARAAFQKLIEAAGTGGACMGSK